MPSAPSQAVKKLMLLRNFRRSHQLSKRFRFPKGALHSLSVRRIYSLLFRFSLMLGLINIIQISEVFIFVRKVFPVERLFRSLTE